MSIVARRLTSTGTILISGEFDEVTKTTISLTTTSYFAAGFDEVSLFGGPVAMRETSSGTIFISGIFDEVDIHIDTGPGSEALFTTPGTYSWTAPIGVTSVSVVAVGGGGGAGLYNGGGGGGGALAYKNNIAVTPGQSYTVIVGAAGTAGTVPASGIPLLLTSGGDSSLVMVSSPR
jgi:hypothetical protein